MTWTQNYLLFGDGLLVSSLLAATPILMLLILLGVLRKPAWMAGVAGLVLTFALATVVYRIPLVLGASAAGEGAAFGLFPITWIIFWAIALFRISTESGQFEIIKNSIGHLTSDPRIQAVLIAFAFGAFVEGAAGFGAPVVIASTMLVGLDFPAFSASAVCLLGNSSPVAFGSIGIPVVTLAGTTGLPFNHLSADVGLLCAPVAFIMPAYMVVAMWGFRALSGIWLPIITSGGIFAVVQLLVASYMGAQLANILASLASITALVTVIYYFPPKASPAPALVPNTSGPIADPHNPRSAGGRKSHTSYRFGELLYAWLPYIFLVACVLLSGWGPAHRILEMANLNVPWPFLNDRVLRVPPIVSVPSPYHAFFLLNPLSTPGTACMAATILSALCAGVGPWRFCRLLFSVARQLLIPTVTVTSVLAIAFLMNYCGATGTLGLAFASAGHLFPFFSALLGWLGVFLTGSDTAANALFGNLQVVTAGRLGLDPVLMASTNSVGGVMGKMISLQTIAVAAAATGISVTDQARLFRFALKHSILLVCLVGCFALLLSHYAL